MNYYVKQATFTNNLNVYELYNEDNANCGIINTLFVPNIIKALDKMNIDDLPYLGFKSYNGVNVRRGYENIHHKYAGELLIFMVGYDRRIFHINIENRFDLRNFLINFNKTPNHYLREYK